MRIRIVLTKDLDDHYDPASVIHDVDQLQPGSLVTVDSHLFEFDVWDFDVVKVEVQK